MILSISILLLALPLTFTHDRRANFRTRRMMLLQPHHRRNVPFVIRVPYSKAVPQNSLFAHSVAWRAKLPQTKSNTDEMTQQQDQQALSDPEVQQFHSQDTNGQVVFGFNSPDQMRIETRNADGTVHGTYSYVDPYGQVIKRQYWDTGSGFHVTSNTYPLNEASSNVQNGQNAVPYTPEVQAARDLHFQLYQQALASLLPAKGPQNAHQETKENITAEAASLSREDTKPFNDFRKLNESTTSHSTRPSNSFNHSISSNHVRNSTQSNVTVPSKTTRPSELKNKTEPTTTHSHLAYDRVQEVIDNRNEENADEASDPATQNGAIVIENPEYLRISWTTDSKKYRLNLYNGTENSANTTSKVQIRHDVPNMYNITRFTARGKPK